MTANEPEDLHDAIVSLCLGELSPAEAEALERQIAREPSLAAERAQIQRALALLPYAAAAEPPLALRARVLATSAAARSPRWRVRWAPAVAALAASLALAIGIDDYRVRRELALLEETARTLAEPNVVLSFALRGTGASASADGRALLDLDARKAALVVRRLPALPSDRVYRLWARVGDREVPCGEFDASADGRIVRQFAIPVGEYTEPVRELFVTIEPRARAERSVGPPVLVSS